MWVCGGLVPIVHFNFWKMIFDRLFIIKSAMLSVAYSMEVGYSIWTSMFSLEMLWCYSRATAPHIHSWISLNVKNGILCLACVCTTPFLFIAVCVTQCHYHQKNKKSVTPIFNFPVYTKQTTIYVKNLFRPAMRFDRKFLWYWRRGVSRWWGPLHDMTRQWVFAAF